MLARLGAGAFGMVTLVKQGTNYYALKQMRKAQIVQMGLQVSSHSLPEHVQLDIEPFFPLICGDVDTSE